MTRINGVEFHEVITVPEWRVPRKNLVSAACNRFLAAAGLPTDCWNPGRPSLQKLKRKSGRKNGK